MFGCLLWCPAHLMGPLQFSPPQSSSASGGHNKPCKSVKLTENKDVQTHAHTRLQAPTHTQTCTHTRAYIFFIKLLHLHIAGWLPTETPSVQQTDSTCLQLMDLNCHIFTSPGRNKLCASVCVSVCGLCSFSSIHFFPDEMYWACVPVPAQPFGEQPTQSSDGLPWRKAISYLLNGPNEDANISLISHCSHLNE